MPPSAPGVFASASDAAKATSVVDLLGPAIAGGREQKNPSPRRGGAAGRALIPPHSLAVRAGGLPVLGRSDAVAMIRRGPPHPPRSRIGRYGPDLVALALMGLHWPDNLFLASILKKKRSAAPEKAGSSSTVAPRCAWMESWNDAGVPASPVNPIATGSAKHRQSTRGVYSVKFDVSAKSSSVGSPVSARS